MEISAVVLGCSKCRYSKRGCKRCKDPDFQARQLAKANKAQPGASEQHKRAIKRRRNRTVGRPETETPPAAKRSRKRAHSVSHNPTPKEIVGVDETVELHAETRAADTAEQLSNSPAKKRIGSGLELGLAAGLLSLPVTDAAEQQSLEDGTLEQRGQRHPATSLPTSTAPGTASDISCSSTQATGAAAEQSSRGQDANGSVGRKEGPEEQKQRQRNFMDLLHSKIRQKHEQRQQQQQQGATNDGPSLAAALALGARRKKVCRERDQSPNFFYKRLPTPKSCLLEPRYVLSISFLVSRRSDSLRCLGAGQGGGRVQRRPSGFAMGAAAIAIWPHRGAAVRQPLEAASGLHLAQQDLGRAGMCPTETCLQPI